MMISFGAKDLVSDVIAGFFTIVEGTYKVGDFVTVGNWSGVVVEIGLRTTKIRSFAETKVIANSAIRDVINANGDIARAVLKVPIAYDSDLQAVEVLLNEELPKLTDVIPGLVQAPQYEGVESVDGGKVNLNITLFVKNKSKAAAFRRLNREIKLLFDSKGIVIK
jgi:small conductance mechanosensitive channel